MNIVHKYTYIYIYILASPYLSILSLCLYDNNPLEKFSSFVLESSGFMKSKVPVAQTPNELVGIINSKFLSQPRNRPYEPLKSCFKLDYVRDYKTWFSHCGKKTVGIFGPSAPHFFEFRLRSSDLALLNSPLFFSILIPSPISHRHVALWPTGHFATASI